MQGLSGDIAHAAHGLDDSEKVKVPVDGGGDDGGTDAPVDQPAAVVNLCEVFRTDEQSKIAAQALDEYDEDLKGREEHMRRLKRWYELYAGVLKIKNWPYQNCSNVNVPLLTYSVLQVHGRLFDMLLPAKGNIYNSVPTRATDPSEVDRAERTELFVNWYIREMIPEYRMSYDATFWQLLIFGSAFRYFYWDETEGRICAEWVGVDDMVIPYKCKITDPSMRGVRRYTLVRWMSLFEIQERGDYEEYANTDKVTPSSGNAPKAKSDFKQSTEEIDGVNEPGERRFLEDEDRQVLEQHRWLRMPKDERHPAFDGKPHPVIVTIDEASRTVLRIVLREEDDPADARRFQREQQEYMQQASVQPPGAPGGDSPGGASPAAAPSPAEPPRPVRKREVCFFTHYMCFQGEGFYGLGLGHFIGPMNEAINTLINQQIDRATVNNSGGGYFSRQARMQRGPIVREPGRYEEMDVPASAMKDILQSWPQVNPDPEGRWFITYIEQMANRVGGTGDTLSGEPVGSNETARAAMARYEQAQKQISVLAARVMGYLTCDARIIWRLLSVYLDESTYADVVDSSGKPQHIPISRNDFIADAKVTPTADPRMTSHAQRIDEAQQFLGTVTNPQGPPELVQNPAVRRAAVEAYLYAADRHEVIDFLGPPPGPPRPPPPVPQWEENANFLREKDQQVNPADDDDAHLIEMQMFDQDPLGGQALSPTARKMFENHQRGHLAAKIEKARRADDQQQSAMGGPPGGGSPGMAGQPGQPPPGGGPPAMGAGQPS